MTRSLIGRTIDFDKISFGLLIIEAYSPAKTRPKGFADKVIQLVEDRSRGQYRVAHQHRGRNIWLVHKSLLARPAPKDHREEILWRSARSTAETNVSAGRDVMLRVRDPLGTQQIDLNVTLNASACPATPAFALDMPWCKAKVVGRRKRCGDFLRIRCPDECGIASGCPRQVPLMNKSLTTGESAVAQHVEHVTKSSGPE